MGKSTATGERRAQILVRIIGDVHFAVLVVPEPIEVNQNIGDRFALATSDEVIEGDFGGVSGFDHVIDLVFDVIERHWLLFVLPQLFLKRKVGIVSNNGFKQH